MRAGIGALAGGNARAAGLVWDSGHVIVFALLAGALGALRRRLRLERATLVVGLAALAAATEALQRHLPDRTPAAADLAADVAGIGLGLLCARAASRLRRSRGPARRFTMRLGADRRREARPGSAERRAGRVGRARAHPSAGGADSSIAASSAALGNAESVPGRETVIAEARAACSSAAPSSPVPRLAAEASATAR